MEIWLLCEEGERERGREGEWEKGEMEREGVRQRERGERGREGTLMFEPSTSYVNASWLTVDSCMARAGEQGMRPGFCVQ